MLKSLDPQKKKKPNSNKIFFEESLKKMISLGLEKDLKLQKLQSKMISNIFTVTKLDF